MPVALPLASATSTPQVVPTVTIFDYVTTDAGVAVKGATVRCILDANASNVIAPQVILQPTELATTTDGNGFFSFAVVANDNINPLNTTFTIITPFRQYQITVPSGGPWQTTATGILVGSPTALAPATSNVTGPLTVTNGLTVTGGATISGGLTLATGSLSLPTGGFSMAGPLTLTAAASQIIPGATSFSVRDTGNANDNLLVSNAGVVTARAGLVATAGGLTVTAGNITATASNLNLGTGTITSGLINGQTISATASLTGSLTVANGLTVTAGGLLVTAGNLSLTAGELIFAAAVSKIVPGATSLSLRNNADAADNLILTNAGAGTLRGPLAINGSGVQVGAGSLANASITANVNGLANGGDVTGLAVTATVQSGRRIRVRGFCLLTKHTTGDLTLNIFEGASQLAQWKQSAVADTNTVTGIVEAILTPTAASHTYKLQLGMSAGTADAVAAATFPGFITMEDIGV